MEQKELKELVEYFYKNKIAVYIRKTNGRFFTGNILEFQGDLIILDDKILGAMPIYFIEIEIIEKRREREWVN